MIEVVYNEGLGFTELRREYETLYAALKIEGELLRDGGKIYQDGNQIL